MCASELVQMFCLFYVVMATQWHLSGFQVVCSAEFCVCLEGKTLLGAQPASAGGVAARLLELPVLQEGGTAH